MKKIIAMAICVVIAVSTFLVAFLCDDNRADIVNQLNLNAETKPATSYTEKVNNAVYNELDFSDKSEWENATKGLIEAPQTLEIKSADGSTVVWSQKAYDFLDESDKAPACVNPSLWENTKNNHAYGLFEVTDGIYQVRGYDLTNLTIVEGDTGYIIFDPMMSVECAQASMQLVYKNLGKKPIKAVVISHSHADHFGGIKGVISEEQRADHTLSMSEQVSSGKVPIIVPEDFEEHAVSENLYAGIAMRRRANYQYGTFLNESVTGTLAMGIGMGQSAGLSSYISPTYEIKTNETLVIDGVEMEFQLTPGTEAPCEMNTWLPQYNALWIAENCTSTLHNLYTLRGAQIRDGEVWAKYITEAITLYGDKAEVVFQSHNWPHWGNENIKEYLKNTAAVYKYINDQTLAYINNGYTSDEIAHMIKLPDQLNKVWYTRQYYGTVAHNAKAVYQKYMGFYDANPVNLNKLPISESAKKWVEYLGDTDEVLRKAKEDFDNGEYQWVAEITNVLVYADPANTQARLLCADALEQLAYQAEAGTWRNVYLSAATELRHGNQAKKSKDGVATGDAQRSISASSMVQYLAILLDKEELEGENFDINLTVSDTKEKFVLSIVDGVMLIYDNAEFDEADISVVCPKIALNILSSDDTDKFYEAAKVEGDKEKFDLLIHNFDAFDTKTSQYFNIIEP